jgi:hypothetical protein
MNGPSAPLPPGTLDELLSADIDGELERAAADHGLVLDDARVALAAPEAVARRAALVRARDLVARAVPLDPADADRLVASALEHARHENELAAARRRRGRADTARRVAIAAASIVVVFGGIAVLARGTSSSSKSSGSQASTALPEASAGAPSRSLSSGLGDVSTRDALRTKVLERVRHAAGREPQPSAVAAPPPGDSTGKGLAYDAANGAQQRALALLLVGPKGQRGPAVPESAASGRAAGTTAPPSRADCVEGLVESGRVPPAPAFSGTGTSDGKPVFVAVFRRAAGGYEVYVLRATDCSVLRRAVF